MLLTACENVRIVDSSPALCRALEVPLNTHLNEVISHGESIITIGADSVLVTADELASAFDGPCIIN